MIPTFDSATDDLVQVVERLHAALSVRGDIVTPRGRELTLEAFGAALSPAESVLRICGDVRSDGMGALSRYTSLFDGVEITAENIRVPLAELAAAHAAADRSFLAAVRRVRENITEFQQAIMHKDRELLASSGATLGQRYAPISRVGVCVPGGTAAYPSTVLMTVVPAQVAGVSEIAVMAPPTANGAYNPDVLATCHELGVTEVYRMGGAQGVAALAYGVEGVPKVSKIVGPGNLFVALAKKHVYGDVDIDSIAGPSEVAVVADESADPHWVAADLVAQAEHAPGSAVLVTWDRALAAAAPAEITKLLGQLERSEAIEHALDNFSAILVVRDEDEAVELANQIAAEHLQLCVNEPQGLAARITNAGATFLGHFSPVAIGDYIAGPSHVLPTGGTAVWASGLSVNSFLRSRSLIEFDQPTLDAHAEQIGLLANREQLTAHAYSVAIRQSGASVGQQASVDRQQAGEEGRGDVS